MSLLLAVIAVNAIVVGSFYFSVGAFVFVPTCMIHKSCVMYDVLLEEHKIQKARIGNYDTYQTI